MITVPRFVRMYALPTLLAAVSLWLVVTLRGDGDSDTQPPPTGPILQLHAFSATYLDASGQQRYGLHAPYLVQLPSERGTEVHSPTLEIFASDGRREWSIQSEQGWLSPDHNLVVLRDNVHAEHQGDTADDTLAIRTRDLSYYRKVQLLSTDATARVDTVSGWLEGTGLRANLDEGRYTLLWNVRGEYAPPSF